jgi:hypothetical protein
MCDGATRVVGNGSATLRAAMTHLVRFAYLLLAAMVVSSAFVILPPNANIVLISVLIVYVGSHFALSPSVDDEGGGAAGPPEPAMTSKDAAMFPLVGSVALVTLYAAFKFFNRDVVNMLLSVYFPAVVTHVRAELALLRRTLNRALGVRGPGDATLVTERIGRRHCRCLANAGLVWVVFV